MVEYTYHLDSIPFQEGTWTVMCRTNFYVIELAKWFRKSGLSILSVDTLVSQTNWWATS